MTDLRLTSRIRWTTLGVLVAAAAAAVYLGVHSEGPAVGFCFIAAVVLIGVAYAVTATPVPAAARSADPPALRRGDSLWAVPMAFSGDVMEVFAYLQHQELIFGGHGRCDAVDHDAHVTVEVRAPEPSTARDRARVLLEEAGGLVVHVNEARWIG